MSWVSMCRVVWVGDRGVGTWWLPAGAYMPLKALFMPPTLKKLEGHIAFGLSVCMSVCEWVRLLVTFLNF